VCFDEISLIAEGVVMSMETSRDAFAHDPRTVLVREKYFTLRPKPLERWIWQQGLPQAAERVFWVHWEEGMRSGDWCSQLSLKRVAMLCCVDPSTVTRAYQVLRQHGLIRREDPGRDPANPFQQATAVTEVRVPRELLTELSRSPNRPRRGAAGESGAAPMPSHPAPTHPVAATETACAPTPVPAPPRPAVLLRFKEFQRLLARLSASERERYQHAWMQKTGGMSFDPDSAINGEAQQQLQWHLYQIAQPAAEQGRSDPPPSSPTPRTPTFIGPRRLSTLATARVHRKLSELLPTAEVESRLREVLWAVEEGALRRFDAPLAINIALKKLREGAWTRPNRMPPNWLRRLASPETCSAA
jgi:hypothetical protein